MITREKRIIGSGFNGFPQGTNDNPELYEDRDRKYRRVLHAEMNSLLNARADVRGCTIYVYPLPPCSQCAAAIIQAGITRVFSIRPTKEQILRWKSSFEEAQLMFQEAGVTLDFL